MSSFRIEYWCNEGWHVNADHKELSPAEYAQIQPPHEKLEFRVARILE